MYTCIYYSLVNQPHFCREGKIRLGTPAQYYAQAGMLDCVMACNKLTAITNFRYAKRVYTYNNVIIHVQPFHEGYQTLQAKDSN